MKKIMTKLLAIVAAVALSVTCFAAVPQFEETAVEAEAAGKSGVYKENGTWYYYVDGVKQTNFTGLANYKNASGWWYITKGKVDRSVNTVAKNKNGWWYVVNGKVQKNFTGLANYKNSSGWWYIKNGKVDRSYKGLAKNKNGWWYLKNGKVDKSYTGVATNSNGTWYVKNGKVQKSYSGTVTLSGKTYTVKNGKATLASSSSGSGSSSGSSTLNGLNKDSDGVWYYYKDGVKQTSFTGFASNSSGWWYVEKGKVTKSTTGIFEDSAGAVNGTVKRYYVKNSKVQLDYSELLKLDGNLYIISDGKFLFNYYGGPTNSCENCYFNGYYCSYQGGIVTNLYVPYGYNVCNECGYIMLTSDDLDHIFVEQSSYHYESLYLEVPLSSYKASGFVKSDYTDYYEKADEEARAKNAALGY